MALDIENKIKWETFPCTSTQKLERLKFGQRPGSGQISWPPSSQTVELLCFPAVDHYISQTPDTHPSTLCLPLFPSPVSSSLSPVSSFPFPLSLISLLSSYVSTFPCLLSFSPLSSRFLSPLLSPFLTPLLSSLLLSGTSFPQLAGDEATVAVLWRQMAAGTEQFGSS